MCRKRYRVDVGRGLSAKGQVTIFIILGILLLLALLLVVAIQREIVTFKPEEIIPTEKGKVTRFVSSCVELLGNEAVSLIGLQGGYVTVPPSLAKDGSLALSPTHSIPYWAQGPATTIPTLEQIKQRIDYHIEQNLRTCVLGQEAFQEQYDIVEKSGITANTEIVERKVIFNVVWDLEIRDKAGEVITEIVNHQAESNVKLKQAYELARRIVEEEMRQLKLEDITQDLIALEKIPVSGVEISCSKKVWNVKQVKQQLQELLRVNIGQLKVKGTDIIEFPDTLPYYQNHYVWDIGTDVLTPEMAVVFQYDPRHPFTFQVTPSSGSTMKSGMLGGADILSKVCLQSWKFTYDVSYPVIVRIQDTTTGYNFQTAFTVHLVRNTPDRNTPIIARNPDVLDIVDEAYCGEKKVPMTILTTKLIENPSQGVYDATEPLADVDISYTCLKYRCEMGTSTFNFASRGNQAGLTSYFPYCTGGILRATKEGYKEAWQHITSTPGKEVELFLTPLHSVPLSAVHVLAHPWNEPERSGVPVGKDDLVLIRLINVKNGTEFHRSEQVLADSSSLEFLAGADFPYELDITIFHDNQLVGGYRGNWTVPWQELQQGKIVFHTAVLRNAGEEELFEVFSTLEEKSKQLPLPEVGQ